LLQNYPNPSNPDTWIPYELAEPANVTIRIYSVDGRLVRRLDLGYKEIDVYASREKAAYWDGKNEAGEQIGGGVYFYQIQAGNFHAVRKMAIVK
jgi:flagellar hook assembly protein FlgD